MGILGHAAAERERDHNTKPVGSHGVYGQFAREVNLFRTAMSLFMSLQFVPLSILLLKSSKPTLEDRRIAHRKNVAK